MVADSILDTQITRRFTCTLQFVICILACYCLLLNQKAISFYARWKLDVPNINST